MTYSDQYKFTIAIPAFKAVYLSECIQSIINQTYRNFDILIVNDCSPEPVELIVNSFNDTRIKYFKNNQNIGAENLVENWNKCLGLATGDFFIMMGDDDKLEKNYLEEFTKLIFKYPHLDVYHCRSKVIDEESKPFKLSPSWPEFESVYENVWHRLYGKRLQYISDFVYRTSALKSKGGFYYLPLAWGADDITAYIACGTKGIAHINTPLFNYRQSRLTISSSGNQFLKMYAILGYEEWLLRYLDNVPTNEIDQMLYIDILSKLKKEFKRRKLEAVQLSLNMGFVTNLYLWYSLRKKYNLKSIDLAAITFKYLLKKNLS